MRVLVPLDGTDFAASILPDAQRLAGPDGVIILVRDADVLGTVFGKDDADLVERRGALGCATDYLQTVAQGLEADGVKVEIHALATGDPAYAIDEAARVYHADMLACATHGRGLMGRLLWGSVARRALVHSPVPVLLRHAENGKSVVSTPDTFKRRLLVPMDGSPLAEQALPLVKRLATQWQADVRLVHVVPDEWSRPMEQVAGQDLNAAGDQSSPSDDMFAYLQRIAGELPGHPEAAVLAGPVVDRLVAAVAQWGMTEVVLASHGRTGLSRVILGSVADGLVHKLHVPIVVVPSLAGQSTNRARRDEMLKGAVSSARS